MLEFTRQKHKNGKQKKFMAHGKGYDSDNLFTVSFRVLTDAEDYYFSCDPENILMFLLPFFLVLIVWDESSRRHGHGTDKMSLWFQLFCHGKELIQGNRLAYVQDM